MIVTTGGRRGNDELSNGEGLRRIGVVEVILFSTLTNTIHENDLRCVQVKRRLIIYDGVLVELEGEKACRIGIEN